MNLFLQIASDDPISLTFNRKWNSIGSSWRRWMRRKLQGNKLKFSFNNWSISSRYTYVLQNFHLVHKRLMNPINRAILLANSILLPAMHWWDLLAMGCWMTQLVIALYLYLVMAVLWCLICYLSSFVLTLFSSFVNKVFWCNCD